MKILGCDVKFLSGFKDEMGTEESIGLNYVLSAAKEAGHTVTVETFLSKLTIEDIVAKAKKEQHDILALSLDSCMVPTGAKLTHAIKAALPDIITVVGGSHFLSGKIQAPFDIAVIGEGEATFVELLDAISQKKELHQVKGISFFDNDNIVTTPRRERIQDLDSLPWPCRNDLLKTNKLHNFIYPPEQEQIGYASISPSRGCYYDCAFCTNAEQWGTGKNSVIYRSIENVMSEIEHVIANYGTNLIYFADLNFTARPRWVKQLCHAIIKSPLKFHWYAMANISTSTDPELLPLMAQAGCVEIMWGIESVSHDLPEKKQASYERTARTLKRSLESGIINHGCVMIGFPHETKEQILNQIPQLIELPLHCIRANVFVPFPGTRLARECKITDHNLEHHNLKHLVYDHASLNDDNIQEIVAMIYGQFYHSEEYTKRLQDFKKRRGINIIGTP